MIKIEVNDKYCADIEWGGKGSDLVDECLLIYHSIIRLYSEITNTSFEAAGIMLMQNTFIAQKINKENKKKNNKGED